MIDAIPLSVTRNPDEADIVAVILADESEAALADTLTALCAQSASCWRAVIIAQAEQIDVVEAARLWARSLAPQVALAWSAQGTAASNWREGLVVARRCWPGARADLLLLAGEAPRRNFAREVGRGLTATPVSTGWFMPAVGRGSHGKISPLTHLLTTTDAPGLVIRREAFTAGLALDPELDAGDCRRDFPVRAKERGFAGQALPRAGLVGLTHSANEMRVAAPSRWPWRLWPSRGALMLACLEEAPPFVWLGEDGMRCAFADPDRLVPVEQHDAAGDKGARSPQMTCVAARAVWTHLVRWRVLKGLLWRAQRALRYAPVVLVILDEDPGGGFSLRMAHAADTHDAAQAEMAILGPASLSDALRLLQSRPASAAVLRVGLPGVSRLNGGTPGLELLNRAVQPPAPGAELPEGKALPAPDPFHLAGLGLAYPDVPASGRRRVGYLLPLFSFAGVEKVVLMQAEFLTANGCDVHIFIACGDAAWLPAAPWPSNINITLMGDVRMAQGAPAATRYERSVLSEAPKPEDDDLFGVLAGMNAVITTHCLGGYGLARRLRASGTKVAASLHLLEPGLGGLPVGDVWSTLGHADALDAVFVISRQLWRWCEDHGMPRAKLRLLPNAPGYVSSAAPAVARPVVADRRLRALFMGRLDRQKGMDRLEPIITASRNLPIEWRIVGGAVIQRASPPFPAELAALLEPPSRTAQELDSLYDWADILILPSHFEGVPLTILEAQRRGCIALAADVGAVSEAVEHDVDGLLVPAGLNEAETTDYFVRYLQEMTACPERLLRLSEGALTRSTSHLEAWRKGLGELLAFTRGAAPSPGLAGEVS